MFFIGLITGDVTGKKKIIFKWGDKNKNELDCMFSDNSWVIVLLHVVGFWRIQEGS